MSRSTESHQTPILYDPCMISPYIPPKSPGLDRWDSGTQELVGDDAHAPLLTDTEKMYFDQFLDWMGSGTVPSVEIVQAMAMVTHTSPSSSPHTTTCSPPAPTLEFIHLPPPTPSLLCGSQNCPGPKVTLPGPLYFGGQPTFRTSPVIPGLHVACSQPAYMCSSRTLTVSPPLPRIEPPESRYYPPAPSPLTTGSPPPEWSTPCAVSKPRKSTASGKRKQPTDPANPDVPLMSPEKKRRTLVRQEYAQLVALVPELHKAAKSLSKSDDTCDASLNFLSKATILTKSAEFIRTVERKIAKYKLMAAQLERNGAGASGSVHGR